MNNKKRFEDTEAVLRRADNTMAHRKRTDRQIIADIALLRKLKLVKYVNCLDNASSKDDAFAKRNHGAFLHLKISWTGFCFKFQI